jgi:hypothetical protein
MLFSSLKKNNIQNLLNRPYIGSFMSLHCPFKLSITFNDISLKCKCCVLTEEIQGKFGGNLWEIRQTSNEDFSLQEVFRDGAVIIFFLAGNNY